MQIERSLREHVREHPTHGACPLDTLHFKVEGNSQNTFGDETSNWSIFADLQLALSPSPAQVDNAVATSNI